MGEGGVQVVGRLAPTPSGKLHLGNACAFAAAWLSVRAQGGRLLLRIEDVDRTRARDDIERDLRDDMAWLGLTWDRETPRQSERDYTPAIQALGDRIYHCQCTRAEIRAGGGHDDAACRARGSTRGALRFALPPGAVTFEDRRWGTRRLDPGRFGDPVLRRGDGVVAYTLAVVADDVTDGVNEVVRGADLLDYSAVQAILWESLGRTPPTWLHAPLLLGGDGRKLSKSHGSLHIGAMREAGWTPAHVWRLLLPMLGLPPLDGLQEAAAVFDPQAGPRGPLRLAIEPDAPCPAPDQGISWRRLDVPGVEDGALE